MARKPRIHVPGGMYHVMLRGNGGQKIFYRDKDYSYLYLLMKEGSIRFGYRVHAFCCMINHVHLIIQVSQIPLSKVVQKLSFRYTRQSQDVGTMSAAIAGSVQAGANLKKAFGAFEIESQVKL